MRVLTPSGYCDPSTLANGAELCAFDAVTGAPIINTVENIDFVDHAEWCRWWQCEEIVPAYNWVRINGTLLLFREQSVWRNGTNVCHARDLVVGDEIYDDGDHAVSVTTIEVIEDRSLAWYRFDVSGDHSYIADGSTVHNASRFWVGGTGTWDSSSTTHWASSTGGTSGQSVPGSADTVTLDASSGGGTVTVNFGGTVTIQSLAFGTYAGTIDFSANNNSVTLSANTTPFNGSGSVARTLKMGSGAWNFTSTTGNTTVISLANTTSLTLDAGTSTINITNSTSAVQSKTINIGSNTAITLNNVNLLASGQGGYYAITGNFTLNALTISAPAFVTFNLGSTVAVSSISTSGASSSSGVGISSSSAGSAATISSASDQTLDRVALRDLAFAGGGTFAATNSMDLGHNSGITISGPSSGGGSGVGVIGG